MSPYLETSMFYQDTDTKVRNSKYGNRPSIYTNNLERDGRSEADLNPEIQMYDFEDYVMLMQCIT